MPARRSCASKVAAPSKRRTLGKSSNESLGRRIEQLIAPEIRALSAYAVADARGLIKLDAMENPYAWPKELEDAWHERLRVVELNRYPDPRARELKSRLREVMAIPAAAELLLGNGSDELIQLLVLAVGGAGSVVLAPDPSFAMYALVSRVTGRRFVNVALDESNFDLRLEATLEAIREHQPALSFFAFPNNPTGNLFAIEHLDAILDAASGLVVIDEAYAPFAGTSYLPQIENRENLLVLRTVSKLGLAGLRLGVLAGAPAWIEQLDKLRLPYNLNVLTQVTAELALSRYDLFERQTRQIVRDRDDMYASLEAMPGVQVWPSKANFVLVRTSPGSGTKTVEALRARGILVKNFDGSSPLLRDCMRVTVGRPEENAAFLEALEGAISS